MTQGPHKQAEGMVDVSEKTITKRIAKAKGLVCFSSEGFKKFIEEGSPKGDILETARVAAVMAAKNTPQIIPLCHPLALTKVKVTFEIMKDKKCVVVFTEVYCNGQTGVEMEALTAVNAAALTIYDMMKWADKTIRIDQVCLLHKSGGKSGEYNQVDA